MDARLVIFRRQRLAAIRSRVNHPADQNAFDKIINTPDMIIFRAEVKARLDGGAPA